MRFRTLLLIGLLVTGLALVNLACRAGSAGDSVRNQATNGASQTPPKRLTPADVAKLRWIEGSWRGTGDIEKPFFERYHFENETTMVMESLTDESLSKVGEVTHYELKDGQFGDGRYVATAIDETSATFEPVAKTGDSFRWQRVSANSWKAILTVPATANKPARQINYILERWPQKSPPPPGQ